MLHGSQTRTESGSGAREHGVVFAVYMKERSYRLADGLSAYQEGVCLIVTLMRADIARSVWRLSYGMEERGIVVRLLSETRDLFLFPSIQIGCGALRAFCSRGNGVVKLTTHLHLVPDSE